MKGREEGRGDLFCPHNDGIYVLFNGCRIRGCGVIVEDVPVVQKPLRFG
jgi:hypothetical protein